MEEDTVRYKELMLYAMETQYAFEMVCGGDDEGWRCAATRGEASLTTMLLRDEDSNQNGSKCHCYWRRRQVAMTLPYAAVVGVEAVAMMLGFSSSF